MDNHELGMLLVIGWRKMYSMCMQRSTCIGCPYFEKKACDRVTTETILEKAADAFEEHLAKKALDIF